MNKTPAHLIEIFDSIQGEGPYLGLRQLFIRFSGCNLSCAYCDTNYAELVKQCRVEQTPGKADFKKIDNPLSAEDLQNIIISKLGKRRIHHSISITGGEPLLQVEFLKEFLPEIKKVNLPIYLETNGTLPDHLSEIIDLVDIIAFDIKIPSATGLSDYSVESRKALSVASQKEVFVKAVYTKEVKPTEIDAAAKLVAEINPEILLVLQPATPGGTIKHLPPADLSLAMYSIAKRSLANVRIIPQVHKFMKIL
ncbi:MAG: 7-carboxy-7-deazaguanine synthase QueE [Candidatus Margulisbacteria bacterium]|nr:7-carboxy-7-deazaguanine synthase QueE [Candidatus Margulisiibacteriota bacterium]MBU1021672.1 7-carboxy-7-deazaguanine synthase QueE [Candidatus Margulisiibacteriota bacterium]MBU1729550.1 7-carboxy-7-deazaguanine synthase QueE [Candidatus Margulisiibacteriota bacterium]MBU1955036.1 7-carboxy-7-deazaguanine synthase QueE [Candidatus Margulisiibacteriota bacterium]